MSGAAVTGARRIGQAAERSATGRRGHARPRQRPGSSRRRSLSKPFAGALPSRLESIPIRWMARGRTCRSQASEPRFAPGQPTPTRRAKSRTFGRGVKIRPSDEGWARHCGARRGVHANATAPPSTTERPRIGTADAIRRSHHRCSSRPWRVPGSQAGSSRTTGAQGRSRAARTTGYRRPQRGDGPAWCDRRQGRARRDRTARSFFERPGAAGRALRKG